VSGKGAAIPHFTVTTTLGATFSYTSIWQRRNLVLITAGGVDPDVVRRYAVELTHRAAEFDGYETECVVTRDHVHGIPERATVIADRWGEIVHIGVRSDRVGLPTPHELLDWVAYLQIRCPECEGEAR
jgi:hypothetical protein